MGGVVAACARWGHEDGAVGELAPRCLVEVSAWAAGRRPYWAPLQADWTLHALGVCLPLSGGRLSPSLVDALLSHLAGRSEELDPSGVVSCVELCALAATSGMVQGPSDDGSAAEIPSQSRAQTLLAVVDRRAHQIPLKELPRALCALLQLLPSDALGPTLERTDRRLTQELATSAYLKPEERTREVDADALGEFLFAFASCGGASEALLDVARDWLLAANGLDAVRSTRSLIHLLHSLAVLGTARGDLLRALIATAVPRIPSASFFEIFGLLDAAVLLQAQGKVRESPDDPPPSGLGEEALDSAVRRASDLGASLSDHELLACARLLSSLQCDGATAQPVHDEVRRRELDDRTTES